MSELLPDNVPDQPSEIAAFCHAVIARRSDNWPPSEQVIAEEFLTFFRLTSFLTFEGLTEFCESRLKIKILLAPLPEPLRGFNSCYFGKREIVIANDQTFPAATLHTLLHEMREIIEREFADLGWPTVQSKESDFEERAECFATAVQVFAVIQLVPGLLQNASEIQRKWVRIGVYAMIFTGTILYTLTFASLPRIEDAFLIKSTQ